MFLHPVVVLLEGRDASGKTTTAREILAALGQQHCAIVSLPPPFGMHDGAAYFRRWAEVLPRKPGDVRVFDRSWYNRAVVEPVMGFCSPAETESFFVDLPRFESELVQGGLRLVKILIQISEEERARRLESRRAAGRLTEVDAAVLSHAEAYDRAEREMVERTSIEAAPWLVLRDAERQERLDVALSRIDAALRGKG